jgi:hypothetical protein
VRARDKERIATTITRHMRKGLPMGNLLDHLMDRFELSQTQAEDAVQAWQEIQDAELEHAA